MKICIVGRLIRNAKFKARALTRMQKARETFRGLGIIRNFCEFCLIGRRRVDDLKMVFEKWA